MGDISELESQFRDRPICMGVIYLAPHEDDNDVNGASIWLRKGLVDVAIFEPGADDGTPDYVLTLTATEARDLAGMLTYAAGRVAELKAASCNHMENDEDDD